MNSHITEYRYSHIIERVESKTRSLMTLENGSTVVSIRSYLFSVFFFFLSFSLSFVLDICLYTRNGSFFPSSISCIIQSPTNIEIVVVYNDIV